MYKYETKVFKNPAREDIDRFLNSLAERASQGFFQYEIVGFVATEGLITITVRSWSPIFNKKDEEEVK